MSIPSLAMNINTHRERGSTVSGVHGTPPGARKTFPWTNRNHFFKSLPSGFRHHFIAISAEFAGTFLFLFFAFSGTQAANAQIQHVGSSAEAQGSNPSQLLYISLCFGFSLAVNAWVFSRISGGFFNPAVSI